MITKKLILNADDFGLTQENNQAVLEGYNNGFLTSTSICANGNSYDNAINSVLPDCPKLSVGIHLNITEGKALTDCSLLVNKDKNFNKNYIYILLNRSKQLLLKQIEYEFRAQIEKIIQDIDIDHINSHNHIHSIPEIFEITCKLAKEYNIKYIRTLNEKTYFVPNIDNYLSTKFSRNIIQALLLKHFTKTNKNILNKYGIKTNNYIIGIEYREMMTHNAIIYGLKHITNDSIAEAIIHPRKYGYNIKNSYTNEFILMQDFSLKDSIIRLGFDITNYKELEK